MLSSNLSTKNRVVLSPLLGRMEPAEVNKELASRVCKQCEAELATRKAENIKEYKWEGREYVENDLFPLKTLNIQCDHKGRAENPNKNMKAKVVQNFHVQMNSAMAATGKTGYTRYQEEDNIDWITRAAYIGEELVKPRDKMVAETRARLNSMTEHAINKKRSGLRDVLHRGHWKYKDSDFKEVERKRRESRWKTDGLPTDFNESQAYYKVDICAPKTNSHLK